MQLKQNENIGCIIWADDILLISRTEKGLQNMLNALKTYADTNCMTINTKKTQTIIFNKSGHHIRRHFHVGKDRLDSTREYIHLGFMVTPSGEIGTGLKDLKNRALRELSKLTKKMGMYFKKISHYNAKTF